MMDRATNRRLNPRLWHSDYVLLTKIRETLKQILRENLGKVKNDLTLLDFGSGDSPYRPIIEPYVREYIACDLASNPHADITIGLDSKIPMPDSSVDIVLSIQVLEHVLDADRYLSECNRILRTGGLLLLSTHGWWTYHPFPNDLRRWTYEGLKFELQKNNLHVIHNYWIIGMLAYSSQLRNQCFKGLLENRGFFARVLLKLITIFYQVSILLFDKITPSAIGENNSAVFFVVGKK